MVSVGWGCSATMVGWVSTQPPQNGHIGVVCLLLEHGAAKDAAGVNGSTPLLFASQVCGQTPAKVHPGLTYPLSWMLNLTMTHPREASLHMQQGNNLDLYMPTDFRVELG